MKILLQISHTLYKNPVTHVNAGKHIKQKP